MQDEATTIAARHHFLETHLVRGVRRGESPTLAWARTGAPHPELNRVLWFTPGEIERSLERMHGVPALWALWPGTEGYALTEAAARDAGLSFIEEEPLMVLPLTGANAVESAALDPVSDEAGGDGVRIEVCHTEAELTEWAAFWAAEDAQPDDVPRIVAALAPFAGLTGAAGDRAVTHLIARSGDAVVGCAAAVVVGASAAVEHVIVDPGWRSRGIGSRLTRAAIDVATQAGAAACVLTASPDGEGLYRRLGFTDVCRVRSYGLA